MALLNVTLVGDRELIARLDALPEGLRAALTRKVAALALLLEDRVKRKLTNDVLHVRTGALRRSIAHAVDSTPTQVAGRVFSSGDVKYAAIHEFGGRTRAHVIEARNAKALAFMMNGKQAFFRKVNHPGSNIPERSFLRASLGEMKDQIATGLEQAVEEGLKS